MEAPPEPGLLRRVLTGVRRGLLASPLLLPLVAVVGVIWGGWISWVAAAGSFVVPLLCRLWRISLAVLLCVIVAWLHGKLLDESAQQICRLAVPGSAVTLEGTVERKLSQGVVLGKGLCQARVLVRGENDLSVGEQVQLVAEAAPPRTPVLPGSFDVARWMKGQGIAAEFYLIRVESRSPTFSLHRLRAWGLTVRDSLAARLMPPGTEAERPRQVLCALVLGARERAEEDTLDDFRRGGCLHAFAVSGLHVGLFSAIMMLLLRFFRLSPHLSRPLAIVGVGLYVLVTGASVPALRAYILLLVLLGALILKRRCQPVNTWSFAALLVLLPEPTQLFNAGFLLSFAVYAALCVGLHYCLKESSWFGPDSYIPPRIYTRGERLAGSADMWLRGVIIVSLSAWLIATPITVACFHTFNTWSVLTNIVITPVLPVVMCCGILHLALGWLPWVCGLTDWLAVKAAEILLGVVAAFGALPGALLPADAPAGAGDLLISGTGFGQFFTVLGSPGLAINPGNEANVHFRTQPALFHAGIEPAVILCTRPGESFAAGGKKLRDAYPDARLLDASEIPDCGISFRTTAGIFSFYPPPADYPRRLADSRTPIIRWQQPDGRSVLYLGNAPADAWLRMPLSARKADIAIVGKHPVHPISVSDLVEAGLGLIIALPGADAAAIEPGSDARLIRMRDDDDVQVKAGRILLNGSTWSAP